MDTDTVLCHCTDEPHLPRKGECAATAITGKVTASTRPFSDGPAAGTPGSSATAANPSGHNGEHAYARQTARGTCPVCGRTGVKVERVERRAGETGHPFVPGVRLGFELVLTEHRTPGKGGTVCAPLIGPAETAFTASVELRAFLRDHGREALAGFEHLLTVSGAA